MANNPYNANFGGTLPNPHIQKSDAQQGWHQLMFPLEDAERSFNNVLHKSGYNIYAANPFTQSLQRSARGLRQAFIQDRVLGTPSAQFNSASEDFGSYLTNELRSGNIYATLNRAANQMPQAVQRVRDYQNALASGGQSAQDANPYLQLLADELSANDGQGTSTALTYLRAPVLGPQIGRAYNSFMNAVVDSAYRALADDQSTYRPWGNRDIWSYIFGNWGSPF